MHLIQNNSTMRKFSIDKNVLTENYANPTSITPEEAANQPLLSTPGQIGYTYEQLKRYIPGLVSPYDFQEQLGIYQPASSKVLNGIGKMGITTAATFSDAFIGTAVGLVNMVGGGSFTDNPYSRAVNDLLAKSEEWLPNYRTHAEENMNLLQKLGTANFWADTIIKNTGFALGMLGAALVGDELAFSRIFGASKLEGQIMRALGAYGDDAVKGIKALDGTILQSSDDVLKALYTNNLDLANLSNEVIKNTKMLKIKSGLQAVTSAAWGAQGEARFESINTRDETYNNLIKDELIKMQQQNPYRLITENDIPEERKQEFKKQAAAAGNIDFALNIPLLTAGELIQFGKVLGRGYKFEKRAFNLLQDKVALDETGKMVIQAPKGFWQKAARTALVTGKVLERPYFEGQEEQLQFAIQKGSEDYIARRNDPNTQGWLTDGFKATVEGLSKAYGTQEGWENFLAGFITSMIPMPTFGAKGAPKFMSPMIESIKELKEGRAAVQAAVNSFNKMYKTYEPLIKGITAIRSYEQDKSKALENDDVFSYESANSMQLTELVVALHELGRIDILKDKIAQVRELSGDDIVKMLTITKDAQGNPLPQEKWINPYENTDPDEVKQIYNQRLDKLQAQIDTIAKIKEGVETQFGKYTSAEGRVMLIHDLAYADDLDNRIKNMSADLQKLGVVDSEKLAALLEERAKLGLDIADATTRADISKLDELNKKIIDGIVAFEGENARPELEAMAKANPRSLIKRARASIQEESTRRAGLGLIHTSILEKTNTRREEILKEKAALNENKEIAEEERTAKNAELDKQLEIYDKVLKTTQDRLSELLGNNYDWIADELKALEEESARYTKAKEELDALVKQQDALAEKIAEVQTNKLATLGPVYGLSKEEYINRLVALHDAQEQLNANVAARMKEAPHLSEDIFKLVTDISRAQNAKLAALNNYMNNVKAIHDNPEAFQKRLDKLFDHLGNRAIESRIATLKEATDLANGRMAFVDNTSKEVLVAEKTGDKAYTLYGHNASSGEFSINKGTYDIDKDFIEKYTPLYELQVKKVTDDNRLNPEDVNGTSDAGSLSDIAPITSTRKYNRVSFRIPYFRPGVLFVTTDAYYLREQTDKGDGIPATAADVKKAIDSASTPQQKANIRYDYFNSRNNVLSGRFKVKVRELTAEQVGAPGTFEGVGKFAFIVDIDGDYVDMDGKKIPESEALENGIYTSIRLPQHSIETVSVEHPEDSSKAIDMYVIVDKNNRQLTLPIADKKALQEEINNYERFYNKIKDGDILPITAKFQGKEVGGENRPTGEVLSNMSEATHKVTVVTKGFVEAGNTRYTAPNGFVFVVDENNNVIQLQPRTLTEDEVNSILEIAEYIAEEGIDDAGNLIASKLEGDSEAESTATTQKSPEEAELEAAMSEAVKKIPHGTKAKVPLFEAIASLVYTPTRSNLSDAAYNKMRSEMSNMISSYSDKYNNSKTDEEKQAVVLEVRSKLTEIIDRFVPRTNNEDRIYFVGALSDESLPLGLSNLVNIGGNFYELRDADGKLNEDTRKALKEALANRMMQISTTLVNSHKPINILQSAKRDMANHTITLKTKEEKDRFEFVKKNTTTDAIVGSTEIPTRLGQSLRIGDSSAYEQKRPSSDEEDLGEGTPLDSILGGEKAQEQATPKGKASTRGKKVNYTKGPRGKRYYFEPIKKGNKIIGYRRRVASTKEEIALANKQAKQNFVQVKDSKGRIRKVNGSILFQLDTGTTKSTQQGTTTKSTEGKSNLEALREAMGIKKDVKIKPPKPTGRAKELLEAFEKVELVDDGTIEGGVKGAEEALKKLASAQEQQSQGTPEQKPTESKETPKTPPRVDTNKLPEEEAPFRLASELSEYEKEDIEKARAWVQSKFGNSIAFEVVDRLVNGKAWGMFYDACIFLYKHAEVGTAYHEAFHAVKRMYLSDREWKDIVNEFRARPENKGKAFTDSQIEEALAEEFRNYVLSDGKLEVRSPKKHSFFSRLLDLIKRLFGMDKSSIKELYDRILSGYYKDMRPIRSDVAKLKSQNVTPGDIYSSKPAYREVQSTKYSASMEGALLEGMAYHFSAALFTSSKEADVIQKLFSKVGVSGEVVEDAMTYCKDALTKTRDNLIRITQQTTDAAEREGFLERAKVIDEYLNNWNYTIERFSLYLKRFGISLNIRERAAEEAAIDTEMNEDAASENETNVENVDRELEDSGKSTDYIYKSLTVSSKKTASRAVKMLIATLAEVSEKGAIIRNELGLPKLIGYGRAFNIMSNVLANTTNVRSFVDKLNILSNRPGFTWVKYFINRIKAQHIVEAGNQDISIRQLSTFFAAAQTFCKYKHTGNIILVDEAGKDTIVNANRLSSERRVLIEWMARASKDAASKDNKFLVIDNGVIKYNAKALLSEYSHGKFNADDALSFLNDIGVYLSDMPEDREVREAIIKKAQSIYEAVVKYMDDKGLSAEAHIYADVNKGDNSIQSIIRAEMSLLGGIDDIENSYRDVNGRNIYAINLYGYTTFMLEDIKSIVAEARKENKSAEEIRGLLIQKYPQLGEEYAKHSLLLDKLINGENIEMHLVSGLNPGEYTDTVPATKMKEPDRVRLEFNNHKKGVYSMSQPADNSVKRVFTFGQFFTKEEVRTNKHINAFVWYLRDEIALRAAHSKAGENYTKVKNNLYRGVMIDLVRKHLATDEQRAQFDKELKEAIDNGSKEAINSMLVGMIDSITQSIAAGIKAESDAMTKLLLHNNLVQSDDSTGTTLYSSSALDFDSTKALTKDELDAEVMHYTVNQMMSKMEQMKLFLGDMLYSKDLLEKYKRNNAAISPKKICFAETKDSPVERVTQAIVQGADNGHLLYDERTGRKILRTLVVEDPVVKSDLYDAYAEVIDDPKPYKEITETDGFCFITMDEWRRMLLRAGDWTEAHELLYHYEMQQYLGNLVKQGKFAKDDFYRLFGHNEYGKVYYAGKEVKAKDIKLKVNSLKAQYYGPIVGGGSAMTMYKASFFPMLPSAFMDKSGKITRTSMAKVYYAAILNGIGIVGFQSANKGLTSIANPNNKLYTGDRQLNIAFDKPEELADNMSFQDTYYEHWGIQQDTGFDRHNENVLGTQMMKIIRSYIYSEGKPVNEKQARRLRELDELNTRRLQYGVKNLVSTLGLTYDSQRDVYIIDAESLDSIKTRLINIAAARDVPENIIEAINNLSPSYGAELIVDRKTMEKLLTSIAKNMTISRKVRGSAPYQVPSTLFEPDEFVKTKTKEGNKEYLTSNFLKTYKNENGAITKMQVYLPSYLEGVINPKNVDASLLQLIGYRIPTQALASIEAIEVAGFLPAHYGDVIVLPTEVVAKTNSDYDIDKMNLIIPRYYTVNKRLADGRIVTEHHVIKGTKTAYDSYVADVETHNIVSENKQAIMSFDEWMEQSIENDMINTISSILTDPSNFKHLVEPVGPGNLSKLRGDLDLLTQGVFRENFTTDEEYEAARKQALQRESSYGFDSFISPTFNIRFEEEAIEGKESIGIVALALTFKIISAEHEVSVAPQIEVSNPYTRETRTVATYIRLPHNTNEKGEISLSKQTDIKGESINNTLSKYASLTVDNIKTMDLKRLDVTTATLPVIEYLVMAGVPVETIHLFLKQPAIQRFLQLQEYYESATAVSQDDDANVNMIHGMVEEEFAVENMNAYDVPSTVDAKTLEDAIKKFILNKGNLSAEARAFQIAMLRDYRHYMSVAKGLSSAVQAVQYDTQSVGSSIGRIIYMLTLKDRALEQGIIQGFDKILGYAGEHSFVKPYRETLEEVLKIYHPYFIQLYNESFYESLTDLAHKLTSSGTYYSKDEVIRILDNYASEFITYLLMTREVSINGTKINKPVSEMTDALFTGEDAVGARIARIKDIIRRGDMGEQFDNAEEYALYNNYSGNAFVRSISAIYDSETNMWGVVSFNNKLEAIESDDITKGWQELFDAGDPLATELVLLAIHQTGIKDVPGSLIKFMPANIYADMISSVLRTADVTVDHSEIQSFQNQFILNNARSRVLMPTIVPGKRRPAGFVNTYMHPYAKEKVLKKEFLAKYGKLSAKALSNKIREALARGEKPYSAKFNIYDTTTGQRVEGFRGFFNPSTRMSVVDYRRGVLEYSQKPTENMVKEESPVDKILTEDAQSTVATDNRAFVIYTVPSTQYKDRTRVNVAKTDITLRFAVDFTTAGEKATLNAIREFRKKYADINLLDNKLTVTKEDISRVANEIRRLGKPEVTINIAGNSHDTLSAKNISQAAIDKYMEEFIYRLRNELGTEVTIQAIYSGGQTGADEAGTKAALKAQIPARIYATEDLRTKKGSGVVAFTDRFKDIKIDDEDESNDSQVPFCIIGL